MDDESWHVLGQLIDSKNIKNLIRRREQWKGENKRMCKALDDLIADGEQKGKAEFVLDLLEDYGTVPDSIKEAILNQTDVAVLKKWHKLAAHVESIDEFIRQSSLM